MKLLLIAVGIAGVVLGPVDPAPAHVGDRVYPIFELTDEDVTLIDIKDGSVDDWLEVVGEPSLTLLDFVGEKIGGSHVLHPSDLDFRIWLAWHNATDRIYGAIEQADDEYVNACSDGTTRHTPGCGSPAWIYDGSILLRIDGDHSGGKYIFVGLDEEEKRQLWHRGAQSYGAINEVFGEGPRVLMTGGHMYEEYPFFVLPPYAEAGGAQFGEQPIITITEFYVTPFDFLVWDNPEETQVSELFPGKTVGLDIHVADHDESTQSFFRLAPKWADNEDASEFCDAVLLGPGGGIPPDISAVGNISWGRIKAQFVK